MDKAELKKVHCNFCGRATKEKVLLEKEGAWIKHKFSIVKCLECGLVYVNPRLCKEGIEQLYNENYYGNNGWDETVNYTEDLNNPELFWKKYRIGDLSKILYYMPFLKNKKFLDVGCALGNFMMFMQEQGAIVEGLEWSSFAAGAAAKRGLSVRQGDIHSIDFPSDYFDIVCAREVIEHSYDPLGLLRQIYRILKPGGLFYYSTGNIASVKDIANWDYVRPEGHIYYFNPKTIANYFKKVGFTLKPRLISFNYFWDYVSIGHHTPKKQLELLFKFRILSRNYNALRNIPVLWSVWMCANFFAKRKDLPLAIK